MSGGPAAAPNHNTDKGNGAGPPASANLDAVLICPKEEGCRQPEERVSMLQSLGCLQGAGEPEPFPHDQNRASSTHKEEEEEPPSAVNSGVIPDAGDSKLSSGARREADAGLPCSGGEQKGIGMSSPVRVLEKGSLGEHEAEAAEERTAGRSRELPASRAAGMGQAECKGCTGTADGPAVVQQGVENGEGGRSPSASQAVGESAAALVGPPTSCVVDASEVPACRGGQGVPEELGPSQNNGRLGVDTKVGPIESGGCRAVGPDLQTDCTERLEDPKPPAKAVPKSASGPEAEAVAMSAAPRGNCLLEANEKQQQTVPGAAGVSMANVSVQDEDSGAQVEGRRPEAACASGRTGELVGSLQGEHITFGRVALGTETPSRSCGGSADLTSVRQGDVAVRHPQKDGVGEDESGSSSERCAGPASACEPAPSCLSPAMSSPAKEEPPKSPEMVDPHCKLDGSSQSSDEILAVASALLEEVIQRAQLIVAQVVDATVAPAGQEASPHPEALPLRGEGTECVQGNLMGTPSAVHHKESKQNQEVVAEAATQLTAVVEQGSPLPDELPAGTCLPVDHPEKNTEDGSSSQPSSSKLGQELPGKVERFPQAPASEAVAQSPLRELPASNGNTEPGLKVGSCGLEAEGNGKAGAAAGGLQGPALLGGTSACADGAPRPPDATLRPEPGPSLQAASPPCGSSFFMEAPLVSGELPALAELPRPGEEVGNVSPRALLQPIAEEPPGDYCDSGSEGWAKEGPRPGAAPLEASAQPKESKREAKPESRLPPLSPSAPAGQAGARDSAQAAEVTFVDERGGGGPDQATLPHDSSGSVAGNPMETPPLVESDPIAGGEVDLGLLSGGLRKEAARPPPVTGQ